MGRRRGRESVAVAHNHLEGTHQIEGRVSSATGCTVLDVCLGAHSDDVCQARGLVIRELFLVL